MNRLNTSAASVALVGGLVLTGCGSDISHGTIVGKRYVPEHTYTYMQPIYVPHCSGTGTAHVCYSTISAYIPISETDPACWQLTLRDGGKTGHICVSKAAWEKAKKGGDW